MKKFILAICLLVFFITSCTQKPPQRASGDLRMVFEGQYIVEGRAAVEWCGDGPGECQTEWRGIPHLVTPLGNGYSVIRGALSQESTRIVPYSRERDLCFTDFPDDFCEPNWAYHINQPNDPLYPEQWGLENIGWERSIVGVPVAVTDSGTDCSHPDVLCEAEYNAITGKEGTGESFDDNGHGTHVASTISSPCNNERGICGVGQIPILSCKFLRASGSGSLSDAIKCLVWAREKGAQVVNASWGCQGCNSKALLDTIKQSRDAGLLVFAAAAGNNGVDNDSNPHYPSSFSLAGFDPVISVAAVGQDEKRASFSNYGFESVDISAPGVGIIAAKPGNLYVSLNGTSMATPHVSAAASILIKAGEQNPKEKILSTARFTGGQWKTQGTLRLASNQGGENPPPCDKAKRRRCVEKCIKIHKCEFFKQKRCRKDCRQKHNC